MIKNSKLFLFLLSHDRQTDIFFILRLYTPNKNILLPYLELRSADVLDMTAVECTGGEVNEAKKFASSDVNKPRVTI